MLILLPPSEAKARVPARRRPVEPGALSFPELSTARVEVAEALVAASARADALDVLGVGASVADDVRANLDLWSAPAAPVAQIYRGVLYDALDLNGMTPRARRRAVASILITSALWGALRLTDRIPAYRLSMSVDLPGVGPLAAYWRPRLQGLSAGATQRTVTVDCRSAPYRAAWPTDPARTVLITVLSPDSRASVSHMAKHTRGLVARHLCTRSEAPPRTPHHLAAAVGERFECALSVPKSHRTAWVLNVVQPGPLQP